MPTDLITDDVKICFHGKIIKELEEINMPPSIETQDISSMPTFPLKKPINIKVKMKPLNHKRWRMIKRAYQIIGTPLKRDFWERN